MKVDEKVVCVYEYEYDSTQKVPEREHVTYLRA